jgi:hypothetical protein
MFLKFLKYRHFISESEHVLKKDFFIAAPTGESWSENLVKKRLSFAREVFKKNPIAFHLFVREKNILFSDAWAIAEAYVGFCVGFTYDDLK